MITENVSTLEIHKLTQKQYDRLVAAGTVNENAIYLTPEQETSYAVIEEYDDAICTIEGMTLGTRMTPSEAVDAVKRGLILKVLSSNATGEFMIFHLVTMYDYTDLDGGVNLVFQRKASGLDGEAETNLTISVAEDGTMTIAHIDYTVVPTGVTRTTLWEGSANVKENTQSATGAVTPFSATAYDLYEVTIEYAGYDLSKSTVLCTKIQASTGTARNQISGHLSWCYTEYYRWFDLHLHIREDGYAHIRCTVADSSSSSNLSLGTNAFTISKIVGIKLG